MSDTPKQPCDHGAVTDHNGSITCDQCGAEVVWSHSRFAWITGKTDPTASTRPAMTPEVAAMANLPRAAKPSGIEAIVSNDIAARQAKGIEKYGMTVAENPLSLREWLEHAYQESLDLPIYLRRAIAEIDSQKPNP